MQTAAKEIGRLRRLNGAGLVWVAQYEKQKESELPSSWKEVVQIQSLFLQGGSKFILSWM